MSVKKLLPTAGWGVLGVVSMILYACSSPEAAPGPQTSRTFPPDYLASDTPPLPVSEVIDARPVALVNGRAIEWAALKPALAELAGAEALLEVVLDQSLRRELDQRGIAISENDVEAERTRLVESLHEDANVAVRLLDELRDRRRLGPTRYRALLWRSAALRRLVQDDVQLTDVALRTTFDQLHGERRQVRLITTSNLEAAEAARRRIAGGELFTDVATEISTDVSAARGGLLEPVCRSDPRYPEALKQAAWDLTPSETSAPVLVGNQYAVVQLVRVVEPTAWFLDEHRDEVTRVARLTQERLLMERLARTLLGTVSITFFDETIQQRFRALLRDGASVIGPPSPSER